MDLREHFGAIDVYLFDQLHRGRISKGQRILDAGCGKGRNLHYLLREGFDVYGADTSPVAIAATRKRVLKLRPELDPARFRVDRIESLSFPDEHADVVICSAVLHFARDTEHFDAMLDGLWRVLRPGGMLFTRLATNVGIEHKLEDLGSGNYRLPDGSKRYLVSEESLVASGERVGGTLLDPIKSTVVQGLRSMGTWVLRK